MTVSGEPGPLEFADYSGILRRRWWLVLALTVLGLAAAVAYLAVTPKAYTATAKVNVTSAGNLPGQNGAVAGGRTGSAVNLDTEAQIVKSGAVARIARRALHSPPGPGLLHHVSVTVPANSSVLEISCQSRSPRQAAACANAFAAGYLRNRHATTAAAARATLRTVRGELTALQKRIARLSARMAPLPPTSSQKAIDRARLATDNGQLHALAGQSAAVIAQEAPNASGTVISAATPPGRPSSPQKLLVLPSGLVAGLILGLIAAFASDRRDTRVRNAREIAQSGVPALLTLSRKELRGSLLFPAWSPAGQEFTGLARYVTAALGDGSQLLIAGTAAGRSSSVVAANLALVLVRRHESVILVCPGQEGTPELLGLAEPRAAGAPGPAGPASPASRLDQAVRQPPGLPGLRVLVLDADLASLSYQQARQLAAQLRASARYVLIEAPREARGGDSLAFAEFCDASLLAVELSQSRQPQVDDCLTRLGRLGVRVIGAAVLPRLPKARGRIAGGPSVRQQLADAVGRRPGLPPPSAAGDGPAAAGDGTGGDSSPVPGRAEAADWFGRT